MTEQEIYASPEYIAGMNSIKVSLANVDSVMKQLQAKFPPEGDKTWAIVGNEPKLVKLGLNLQKSV